MRQKLLCCCSAEGLMNKILPPFLSVQTVLESGWRAVVEGNSCRTYRWSVSDGKCCLSPVKKKVKCTLVQALRLCTGRTAYRGSRDIALLFLDHGTRRGWGVSITPRPIFSPGKDPVPVLQEAGWAPEPVWTGAENLAPTGIRSPDRPARSQSLYRLSYPALLSAVLR